MSQTHSWCKIVMAGILFAVSGCSISILPTYQENDGYSGRNSEDTKASDHSLSDCLQELDEEGFLRMVASHDLTWLMIGASWCPHAMDDWERLTKELEGLNSHGVYPMVVFPEYRERFLCRRSRALAWNEPLYVLSHARYGGRVEDKVNGFLQGLRLDPARDGKYPRHYLLDRNGDVIYAQTGSVRDYLGIIRWLDSEGELDVLVANKKNVEDQLLKDPLHGSAQPRKCVSD
jgi:hypothetical protein